MKTAIIDLPGTKLSRKENEPAAAASTPPCIRREFIAGDIGVLTFDRPGSSANLFDRPAMEELDRHLSFIAGRPGLRGLVFISAKPSIFIAGADLHALAEAGDDLADLIARGQAVFNRVAALPFPTVAAIHGACVGGGCELALACDWRVASPDRATKIGLPETQLGILPAWGGSTRLPRLIGLPKALDIILAGKTLAAKPALSCGLVDAMAPAENLLAAALRQIALGKPQRRGHALINNRLATALIRARVRPELLKKTRGHYPAVTKALDVVTSGLSQSVEASLCLELGAVLELARTDACRNLIRIFFMQERAKKKQAVTPEPAAVRRLAVIGAGVMGAGIAQWTAGRGFPVILRDIDAGQVGKGMANIARLFDEGTKRHAFTKIEARAGLDRIFPAAGEVPLGGVDLVIEAAVEKMDLKKELFRRLDERAGPQTILATNTSALSVSEIAAGTARPERVVGLHFFNPVHRMQLVEVVLGEKTSVEVLRRAVRFVQQIGKLPVVVKDSPGFLVNRILMPYLLEAGHLFESGAEVKDIDEAMLDFGMPMGPLRLIDEVGLDVSRHVAATLVEKFSDRMSTPGVLDTMIAAGLLGRKTGRGFYLHEDGGKNAQPNREADRFRLNETARGWDRAELQARMVMLMVNEAARCLEESVVAGPEDVDFGMIMGTGFAPFRGGPLRYADAEGAAVLAGAMQRMVDAGEPRFAPCELLGKLSGRNGKFYDVKGERL